MENLVPIETIDDEIFNADQARTIQEILAIFVHPCKFLEGTRSLPLGLMFSLIKSRHVGARQSIWIVGWRVSIPGVARRRTKDFVIKGLLTVTDRPLRIRCGECAAFLG